MSLMVGAYGDPARAGVFGVDHLKSEDLPSVREISAKRTT